MAEEFGRSFATLPMGQLICGPIIAVAQGQSELCRVYLDYLFELAFREGDPEKGINSVKFKLPRQIVTPEGDTKTVELEVEAPLLSLVPVPAFTMDEATVQFTMEVKDIKTDKSGSASSLDTMAKFSAWGFSSSVTGKVTTSHENTRTTDQSAKYDIFARALSSPRRRGWQSSRPSLRRWWNPLRRRAAAAESPNTIGTCPVSGQVPIVL